MKILHISKAKSWRGGERQVQNLLTSLKSYTDCATILLCREDSELDKRIDVTEKITHNGNFFSWIFKIRRICKEHSIDIIHAHESKAHTLAILALLFLNVKVIVSRRVIFSVKGFVSKLKYKKTDAIICISSAVKNEMRKVVKDEQLTVIPSAIDITKFSEIKPVVFDFLTPSAIKIGYVAALSKEKDHTTFLHTAKKIIEHEKNVLFYIIGEGKLFAEIERELQRLKLQNHVKLVGFVHNINALIPQLDILLFTSQFEGLGSTILDFFLARKPVVATNSEGVKDLIINGKTGFLCEKEAVEDLAEKVLLLINDKSLQNKLTENAYQFVVSNFSLELLGERHYQFYQNLLI